MFRQLVIFSLVFCVACSATPVSAQVQSCQGDVFRAFDFWLGEWEVKTADDKLAGHNSIASTHQGCLLIESWQGATGSRGTSMNFYDGQKKQWRQLWVSPGAQIDISGGMTDGSMVLEGTIYYEQTDVSHPFRGSWTPLDDGRVRQFFEQKDDAGDWQPWFEGFYKKTKADE